MKAFWAAMLVLLCAVPAAAQDDAGAPAEVWSSCSEYVPEGATRPELAASLPDRFAVLAANRRQRTSVQERGARDAGQFGVPTSSRAMTSLIDRRSAQC